MRLIPFVAEKLVKEQASAKTDLDLAVYLIVLALCISVSYCSIGRMYVYFCA